MTSYAATDTDATEEPATQPFADDFDRKIAETLGEDDPVPASDEAIRRFNHEVATDSRSSLEIAEQYNKDCSCAWVCFVEAIRSTTDKQRAEWTADEKRLIGSVFKTFVD